jgi:hypothetical protein
LNKKSAQKQKRPKTTEGEGFLANPSPNHKEQKSSHLKNQIKTMS